MAPPATPTKGDDMAFKDRPMRCNACNHRFFYTVAEQRKRAEAGMHDHTMLFCSKCKSADVAEVDLSGFNPSPRTASAPTAPAAAPRRERNEARRSSSDSGKPAEDAADLDERQDRPPTRREDPEPAPRRDGETASEAPSDEGHGRRRGASRGRSERGGRGAGRAGAEGKAPRSAGRRGRGGGGRGGGRGGKRREREQPRQTELRVRHMGTVKWFDDDRGYGFIAQDEGGELFVHLTGLIVEGYDRLLEGTPVEYEIERTARGPQAVDVVPLA